MTTKRVCYDLTPENFLARMVLGQKYSSYQLAAKYRVSTDDVRPLIAQLVRNGEIKVEHAARNLLYFRPDGEKVLPVVDLDGPFAIPTRPVTVLLTGQLVGYQAEIARRTSLCMLARGGR
jgi:hypothetical protein